VLRQFAARALGSIRQASDWLVRYGGEEFAIVLPQTHRQGGAALAEKIRLQCAEVPYTTTVGSLIVTASFGAAQLTAGGDVQSALVDLLDRADGSLYASKAQGRNRVSIA
jgi:diguanylate cyclase (GGDEF)-like protein